MEAKVDLVDNQPAEQREREIDKLFRAAIRLKGSDLHLRVDGQPAVRLRGSLRTLNRGHLKAHGNDSVQFYTDKKVVISRWF